MRHTDQSMVAQGGYTIRTKQLDNGIWEANAGVKGVEPSQGDSEIEAIRAMRLTLERTLRTTGEQI